MMTYKTQNLRLKQERLRRGLTQLELSWRLKIAPSDISCFERGARLPWKSAVKKLERFFGLKIDELLAEEPGGDCAAA